MYARGLAEDVTLEANRKRRNVELQYEYERRKLGEMCADYGVKALRDLSEEMEKMKEDLTKTRHNLKLMTLKWDMDIAEIWDNKSHQNIYSEESLARQESVVSTESGFFGTSSEGLTNYSFHPDQIVKSIMNVNDIIKFDKLESGVWFLGALVGA
ncbi:hypothetical protein QYM36_008696, partial [Artemia franciscana]